MGEPFALAHFSKRRAMKEKKDKKSKTLNCTEKLLLAAQIILIAVMLVLIWKIGGYLIDEWKSLDFSRDLQKSVIIMEEPEASAAGENPQETASAEMPEADTPEADIPAAIDFDSLHEISEDAVAWIYDPDGEINYVIAQAKDNDYYLRRLLDGTDASGGTLFMDCRNSGDLSDWNTVIYGHNMKNGTMFASLLDYRSPVYYEEHPVMYLYTPGQRYRVELIAGYTTSVNDLIYSVPATKEDRNKILDHACKVSSFLSDVTVGDEDRLVTLSTCSYAYDDARYVVIGRIVEE